MITYIIPVYNQEQTIGEAIKSAIACAEQTAGQVIVSVNKCTDKTPQIAEQASTPKTIATTIFSDTYVSSIANLMRAIPHVRSDYICMLGGDDEIPVEGQKAISRFAKSLDQPSVIYGETQYISEGRLSKSTIWYRWSKPRKSKAARNILLRRFPNLNGSWFPTQVFLDSTKFAQETLTDYLTSYAGDVAMWWYSNLNSKFYYVPTTSIRYRTSVTQSHSEQYMKGKTNDQQVQALSKLLLYLDIHPDANPLYGRNWQSVVSDTVLSLLPSISRMNADSRTAAAEELLTLDLNWLARTLIRKSVSQPRFIDLYLKYMSLGHAPLQFSRALLKQLAGKIR